MRLPDGEGGEVVLLLIGRPTALCGVVCEEIAGLIARVAADNAKRAGALAAAADGDVADHDHRHREALRHDRGPPPRGECPEQAGKRPQELRDRTAPLPEGRSLG